MAESVPPNPPGPEDSAAVRAEAERLVRRGDWDRIRSFLAGHAEALEASGDLTALYGETLLRTGRTQAGREWLETAVPRLERRGDRAPLRRVMNLLGAALLELGLLEDASATFERVAELAWSNGDDLLLAKARNNLGTIANIRGRRDQAIALYQLAVPAYQRLGSPGGLAECYHNMAITFRDTLALNEADEYETRAIEFAREAGSRRLVALARLGRAEISLRRGESSLAEVGATLAATAFREAADPIGEGDALRLVGVARTRKGELDGAGAALEAALGLTRNHGAALNEAETLRALAEWAAARTDWALARAHADAALTILRRLEALDDAQALSEWMTETLPEGPPR